jgi:GNAT superfamily N-acetyltransferase
LSTPIDWTRAQRSPARIRELLLEYCTGHYREVSKRPDGSSRRISHGIVDAERVITGVPLDTDPVRYLAEIRTRLLTEKERARADPDDEDGWTLGGLSTVLNAVEAAQAAVPPLEIRFEPRLGKKVARRVALAFFGWREFPQAFARMVLTREFALLAGIPALLLVVARFTESDLLTVAAVLWLLGSLVRIASFGYASGIACLARDADGRERLVGGLRLRVQRRARRLWIAGIHVDPGFRGAGIGSALILAAFRLAREEATQGPILVSVFAPAHPASKAIVARQLAGMQDVPVDEPLAEETRRVLQALEPAATGFSWQLAPARFFAR